MTLVEAGGRHRPLPSKCNRPPGCAPHPDDRIIVVGHDGNGSRHSVLLHGRQPQDPRTGRWEPSPSHDLASLPPHPSPKSSACWITSSLLPQTADLSGMWHLEIWPPVDHLQDRLCVGEPRERAKLDDALVVLRLLCNEVPDVVRIGCAGRLAEVVAGLGVRVGEQP